MDHEQGAYCLSTTWIKTDKRQNRQPRSNKRFDAAILWGAFIHSN